MRSAFEQELINMGYTPSNSGNYSSMVAGMSNCRYTKEGAKDIVYGLSEYNKPPTLIEPLTFIRNVKHNDDGTAICYPINDDIVNRYLDKYSPKEIINAIENKVILE